METQHFWMFFVIAIVAGISIGFVINNATMTGNVNIPIAKIPTQTSQTGSWQILSYTPPTLPSGDIGFEVIGGDIGIKGEGKATGVYGYVKGFGDIPETRSAVEGFLNDSTSSTLGILGYKQMTGPGAAEWYGVYGMGPTAGVYGIGQYGVYATGMSKYQKKTGAWETATTQPRCSCDKDNTTEDCPTDFLIIDVGPVCYDFYGTQPTLARPFNRATDSYAGYFEGNVKITGNVIGADISHPEGFRGDTKNVGITSSGYAVPAGKTLYIHTIYNADSSGGQCLEIGGTCYTEVIGTGKSLLFPLPLIISGGSTVKSGAYYASKSLLITGIEVNSVSDINTKNVGITSSGYAVPAGKTLYIHTVYNANSLDSQCLKIGDACYTGAIGTGQTLLFPSPLIISGGSTVKKSSAVGGSLFITGYER